MIMEMMKHVLAPSCLLTSETHGNMVAHLFKISATSLFLVGVSIFCAIMRHHIFKFGRHLKRRPTTICLCTSSKSRRYPIVMGGRKVAKKQTEEEEEPAVPDDRYVSTAPLHLAWKTKMNIPQDKLFSLKEEGYEIKRGRFEKHENKRLNKNWRRLCRFFPEETKDPYTLFGLQHKPQDFDTRNNPKVSAQRIKSIKVMHRMAYKLDNRLICDIYYRCKILYAHKAFQVKAKDELIEENLEEEVTTRIQSNDSIQRVSSDLDINPDVVKNLKRNNKIVKPMRWKKEDDLYLELCIERQARNERATSMPLFMIDWNLVVSEMKSMGYDLIKEQCYKRWWKLNKCMANLRGKRPLMRT